MNLRNKPNIEGKYSAEDKREKAECDRDRGERKYLEDSDFSQIQLLCLRDNQI